MNGDIETASAEAIEALRAENHRLREALAACVPVIEAAMGDHGWLGEHEGIEGALEATGLIAWDVVPPSGEVHTHFDGWEDLEPGDAFWVATKKWGEVWRLANAGTSGTTTQPGP